VVGLHPVALTSLLREIAKEKKGEGKVGRGGGGERENIYHRGREGGREGERERERESE
jgi:hypothetical protein